MKGKYFISFLMIFIIATMSCAHPIVAPTPTATSIAEIPSQKKNAQTDAPVPLPTPTQISTPEPLCPIAFPENMNSLNGLPVENPKNLKNPPLLVSISNFPPTARPQAGLSYCLLFLKCGSGRA